MASVWGPGGLFEQAVQQKYANQGMNAATDRMNAGTNRMRAGNEFTLGLRDADINQMNAQTNRFNADTTRGRLAIDAAGRGPTSGEINSFQLGNSFRPDTSASSTASRPTNYFSGTNTTGMRAFGDSLSGMRALGVTDPEENKFGFRNSGKMPMRMKPMIIRQPGYKNSGKVMGYADSGAAENSKVIPDKYVEIRQRISELAKQGDIDGATNLRMKLEAMETGQGKSGYSNSGSVNEGLRSPKSFGPIGDVEDDTGRDEIDAKVRPGEYLLNPPAVEFIGKVFGGEEEAEEAEEGGGYDNGVRVLDNIVRAATGKEPGPTMMSGGKPGFASSGKAGMEENYVRNFISDPLARSASTDRLPPSPVVQPATTELPKQNLGRLNSFGGFLQASADAGNKYARAIRGLGEPKLAGASENSIAPVRNLVSRPTNKASTGLDPRTAGVASFMQEVADGGASAGAAQQPAAEKQPSLRDFLESQYRELAADKSFVGSAWRKDQMKNIGDMINNMDQTSAVTGSADAEALAKAQKDNAASIEKIINDGFTRRDVDPETGEIKESRDMGAANEFRRFVLANANELGVPINMLDPYQVMSMMKEFEARRGVRDVTNAQAAMISDGVTSRELPRQDEIIGTDKLGLRDALPVFGSDSSASFFGDYVPSLFSGGDADQVAVINRGGRRMRIPLSDLIRNPDGSVNEDVLAQYPQLRPPYQ